MNPTVESNAADIKKLESRISALESPRQIEPVKLGVPGSSVTTKPEPKRHPILNVGAGPAAHEIQKQFPWMKRAAQLPPGEVHPMLGLRNGAVGVRSHDVRLSAMKNAREKVKKVVESCVTHAGQEPDYVYLDELPYGDSVIRNPVNRIMAGDIAGANDIVFTQLSVLTGMRAGLSDLGIVCEPILGMPEGMKAVDTEELDEFEAAAHDFHERYGQQVRDASLSKGLCWSYMGQAAWQWEEGLRRQCNRSVVCRNANEIAWGVDFTRCFANVVFGVGGGMVTGDDLDPRSPTISGSRYNKPKDVWRPEWNAEHVLLFRGYSGDPNEEIGIWYNGNGDEEQYSLDTVPAIIEVMAEV